MCGIGFCGGGITSGSGNLETSSGVVNNEFVEDSLLVGLSLDQIRQYVRIYIDGTEFATAEATSLDSDGIIDLGTNVMNGANFYLSKLGSP